LTETRSIGKKEGELEQKRRDEGVKREEDRTIHKGITKRERRGTEKAESMHKSARLKVDFAFNNSIIKGQNHPKQSI